MARIGEHRWQHVLVVAGHRRRAVAEDRLHNAVGYAGREEKRASRVPQRVWGRAFDACLRSDPREVVAQRAADEWLAQLAGKDQVVVMPRRAGMQAQLGDALVLHVQSSDRARNQGNGPTAML